MVLRVVVLPLYRYFVALLVRGGAGQLFYPEVCVCVRARVCGRERVCVCACVCEYDCICTSVCVRE